MTGLIILIIIGICGLGYLAFLLLGACGVAIGGLSKRKPKLATEREFLKYTTAEEDYKTDKEFFYYLPPGINDLKPDVAKKEALSGIFFEKSSSAFEFLLGKMGEDNPELWRAMIREQKAAEEWLLENKKSYYPTSYMRRTFRKYGVLPKLDELRKAGCKVPADFRPYAPGRKSKEEWVMLRHESEQRRIQEDYSRKKSQGVEALWLVIAFICWGAGIAGWYWLSSGGNGVLGAIVFILGVAFGIFSLFRCEIDSKKTRRKNDKNNRDDIYPGL